MLKQKLKEWRVTHRNNWKQRKEEILQQLADLEKTQELRLLSEDELLQKVHLAMEFEKVAKEEEIAWRQRSRIQWLKQGDKNTKKFHRIVTAHKRYNSIDTLLVEGNLISDPEEIKREITSFYKKLYTETERWRPDFKLQGLNTISEEERDWLQSHFEEAEVLKCIKSCASDKAPGRNGFPMSFFQNFWEVLKYDVMEAINQFHGRHEFERSLNANYVALIPKKSGVVELKDFRPISLIGGIYKVFAKLLAERMKKYGEGSHSIELAKGFKVGNQAGEDVQICHLLYVDDTLIFCEAKEEQNSLMEDFPDLFSFCGNPEASIAETWTNQGWNIIFRRLLNDWEVERVASLLQRLNDFSCLNTSPDTIRWKHDRDGKFSVGRLYRRNLSSQLGNIPGPWKQIWKFNIPTKIKCFTWTEKEETNSHLFLHCRVTSQVWHMFLNILQKPWVMPEHTADLLTCWMRRVDMEVAFVFYIQQNLIIGIFSCILLPCPFRMHIAFIKKARQFETSPVNKYLRTVKKESSKKIRNHALLPVKEQQFDEHISTMCKCIKTFSSAEEELCGKHIRFISGSEYENSDDDQDESASHSQSKFPVGNIKSSDRPTAYPYPSASEEMMRLGLKTEVEISPHTASGSDKNSEDIGEFNRKKKYDGVQSSLALPEKIPKRDMVQSKLFTSRKKKEKKVDKMWNQGSDVSNDFSLDDDSIKMFVNTWKEACRINRVDEVFQRMLQFYKARKRVQVTRMFTSYPFCGLLHVAELPDPSAFNMMLHEKREGRKRRRIERSRKVRQKNKSKTAIFFF
ncbi:hypothetical protein MTR67_041678 [Solanum verrucosum]|uniref:Reverse transcriptase zinc-binding domain-containing protein n=1 Tax=Solanum verrucosum TaxID=315347 RepID=A0AAF0UKL8_SOLVR|nr:hypothetical protein MTR67_041678 [Solanum verrucosum]